MAQEVDRLMVDELVEATRNDGQLYRQQTEPIIKNLARRKENGTYDAELAVKVYRNLVDNEVRKYSRENAVDSRLINGATRDAAARELRDYYSEQVTNQARRDAERELAKE